MKSGTAALLVVGIFAVGVFGFLDMDPSMDHDGGCIASLVNAASCPLQGLESAMYHMSAYTSFSRAVFSSTILLALILLVLLARTYGFAHFLLLPGMRPRRLYSRSTSDIAPRYKFIQWLSLFENSPTLFRSA
ncbi:hypothetical protein HYW59_01030 [Candidatus Kaiserbacteria bacterium]|nr:hypothetical protein [Candidatus Kaiserbacteria bacterium]